MQIRQGRWGKPTTPMQTIHILTGDIDYLARSVQF